MTRLKTPDDIAILRESGQKLGQILQQLANMVEPGVNTAELEKRALKLIKKAGGEPAFLSYQPTREAQPYPSALCVSVNEQVVHGPAVPGRYLKEGDIVSLDIGMRYQDRYTDTALTVPVGAVSEQAEHLMAITKQCLELAIKKAQPGNSLLDIAHAAQINAEANGFAVIRELVGHGVGFAVHEAPQVPNFDSGEGLDQIKLEPGLVIAIEPMLAVGNWAIEVAEDGFTYRTKDRSLSAHFEHTIAITQDGHVVLTSPDM